MQPTEVPPGPVEVRHLRLWPTSSFFAVATNSFGCEKMSGLVENTHEIGADPPTSRAGFLSLHVRAHTRDTTLPASYSDIDFSTLFKSQSKERRTTEAHRTSSCPT